MLTSRLRFLVPCCVVALAAALLTIWAVAAPAPSATTDVIKDRSGFIPSRKYQVLPGTTVGVLVGDVAAMMGQEGRGGPADALAFSAGGGSYRWVYVPVEDKPLITNLTLPVGDKGDKSKTYPSLSMANPATVKKWEIAVPIALVEVEVNDNLGSPPGEGFAATKMKRLDGTKDYPFDVAEVVKDLRKRYKAHVQDQQKAIDGAMSEVQKKALGERKPTGPRETAELFYVTWLPEAQRLRVHFRTRVSDGAYAFGGGALRDPPPLPKDGPAPAVARRPPPPPRDFGGARFGTTFGVEFGMAYEVTKHGKVDRALTLPIETFSQELPPPPGALPRGGPRDLPPPPAKDR